MTAKYYFYAEIKSRVLNEAQSQSPSHTLPIRNLLKNYVSKVLSSSKNIMILFCSVEMILSSEEQEVNFHMFQRKTRQSLRLYGFWPEDVILLSTIYKVSLKLCHVDVASVEELWH